MGNPPRAGGIEFSSWPFELTVDPSVYCNWFAVEMFLRSGRRGWNECDPGETDLYIGESVL